MLRTKLSLPLLLSFFLVFAAITVSGQAKKGNSVSRGYHNTTARYNGYFYANLKLQTALINLAEAHKDDYKNILSLYPHLNNEAAGSYSSELDEAIKKATIVIQKHEPAKWVDDSYYLIGRSYMIKGDYESAVSAFQNVTADFFKQQQTEERLEKIKAAKKSKKSASKKKSIKQKQKAAAQKKKAAAKKKKAAQKAAAKKKKAAAKAKAKGKTQSSSQASKSSGTGKDKQEKTQEQQTLGESAAKLPGPDEPYKEPALSFIKHKPVVYESMIEMVASFTYDDKRKEAASILTLLRGEEKFPRRLKDEMAISEANLFLSSNDYLSSIKPLEEAIKYTRKKRAKARLHYILGQVYGRLNQNDQAIDQFKKVVKIRTPYEMEFNAKMAIAKLSSKGSTTPTSEIIALLKKMLKDGKNFDFKDQIYYALAELYLKMGQKDDAITALKKSIETSISNPEQKGMSYLRLGDIYFEDELYKPANSNYDTCLTLLGPDYPDHKQIDERNKILKELVKQMTIVEVQDSLLNLARMPEKERAKTLARIIDEKRKKEQEKEIEKQMAAQEIRPTAEPASKDEGKGSNWYFYNASLKGSGYNDFIKRFGNRKREDNWRRSDKTVFMDELADDQKEEIDSGPDSEQPKDDLEALTKALPLTEQAQSASNDQIIDALFEIANIYRSQLKNERKAIETYEEMLKRQPQNKYRLECLYNLYLLHSNAGNMAKANEYRSLILSEFPESIFAKVIQDPDYLDKAKLKDKDLKSYYEETFAIFKANNHQEVIRRNSLSDSIYRPNTLKPKFEMLAALSIGQTSDLDNYIAALQNVVNSYPGDEVKTKAEEILSYLLKKQIKTPPAKDTTGFTPEPTTKDPKEKEISKPKKPGDEKEAKKEAKVGESLRFEPAKGEEEELEEEEGQTVSFASFEPEGIYKTLPDEKHYYVIINKDKEIKTNELVNKVNTFNTEKFKLDNLKTSSLLFTSDATMILVKSFKNSKTGMGYHSVFSKESAGIIGENKDGLLTWFLIAESNFIALLKQKDLEGYLRFFAEGY